MNISQISAAADQLCVLPLVNDCSAWMAVEEAHAPQEQGNSLLVYPNPGSGSFTVSFSNPLEEDCSLYVLDVLGREVISIKLSKGARTTNFDLHAKGVYFVTLKTADRLMATKLVVQ